MKPSLTLALALLGLALPSSQEDPPIDGLLRSAPPGVCILLGAGNGAGVRKAASGGRWVVHVFEPDGAKVLELRQALDREGLSGLATIEPWTGGTLPLADHLANLVVVEAAVPEPEVLRILVPEGTALVRKDHAWTALRKPRSEEFDEWTHWRHDADGNMVSRDRAVALPTGLRWVAGPPQDAGGRKWYYDHTLVSSNGRNFYEYEDSITARDAYNGVLLWSRPVKTPVFRETGVPLPESPTPKMKLGVRTSKVRPVASGDRLYVASEGKILALDARTGETASTLGEVPEPRELLLAGGLLVVTDSSSVRAYDVSTSRRVWESALEARRIVAQDTALYLVTARHLVSLELSSGRERWRKEEPDADLALTCTAHGDALVIEKSTLRDDPIGCGIKVYSTGTGELLWNREYKPDMTHYREARAYFAQGLLWLPVEKEGLLGLDPKNGSQRKQWTTRGKHCAAPVATERFFLAPECEATDLADGTETRAHLFKSACRLPFIPANGLLYTFPVQCECYPMLRGYMGLSSTPRPAGNSEDPRLRTFEPPPVRGGLTEFPSASGVEWPLYRHDAYRSGSTPAPLPRTGVQKAWETRVAAWPEGPASQEWKANPFVPGILTPPVAARGLVFVAAPDLHRLIAIDAKLGTVRWTHLAGGRMDGPPTLHEGICLFGTHDGWVTALRAEDGELLWKFRAAPREARIMAYGQLESPWPVVSSVLVDRGLAYVAAGRHPTADGGVHVLALRPETGELVWEKTLDNLDAITKWYGGTLPAGPDTPAETKKVKVGVDFEPVDLLVRDGDGVAMSRWKFDPARGDVTLALDSVTYLGPEGLKVPRGLWGYGIRQTKQVQPRPPVCFQAGKIRTGPVGDLAILLAGGTLVSVTSKGELRVGETLVDLEREPIRDGLISAYGALYVSTQAGTLICLK